jgi:pectate lyase
VWFDHDHIYDGSDGNLDVVHGSDLVTISWTKFSYSSARTDPDAGASGHRFSNLIGNNDDNEQVDSGRLNVTFSHVWWADNVNQRMPRTRFGKVHVFNSLYTAEDSSYCIGPGRNSSVLSEGNVFFRIDQPVNTMSFVNDETTVTSRNNVYRASPEPSDIGTAFVPPYDYEVEDVATIQALVETEAGPQL